MSSFIIRRHSRREFTSWRLAVTNPQSNPPSAPLYQPARRRLLSPRKVALMASVVAGLGVAIYGLDAVPGGFGILASPAHAQVNSDIGKAAQPTGFADIVQRVKPSVISVKVTMTDKVAGVSDRSADGSDQSEPPMERFFRQFGGPEGTPPGMRNHRGGHGVMMGQGSGFFISPDGYAVTNNHVVDGADKVEVTTDDGKTHTAKVIGTDARTDLALIKVEGGTDFPYAKLAGGKPRIGDWVLAVGNPFGLGGTVTAGIVSASGRDIGNGPYDDFIQIDAPVNKGNSGGPAFNMQGEVVGVNTAIYIRPRRGSVGIAFSIPAPTVKNVIAATQGQGNQSPVAGSEFRSSRYRRISQDNLGHEEKPRARWYWSLRPMVRPPRPASNPARTSSPRSTVRPFEAICERTRPHPLAVLRPAPTSNSTFCTRERTNPSA